MSPDSGTDLVSDAPILLCSAPGSTRASTAVLSQIAPAPGAVAAAQALPEDCGRLPPLVAFWASSSDIVRGSLATVMSAPMRLKIISALCNGEKNVGELLADIRLARVREELLHGTENATVTGVAMRWGFTHTGRFAAAYRRKYGESPSQTLHA